MLLIYAGHNLCFTLYIRISRLSLHILWMTIHYSVPLFAEEYLPKSEDLIGTASSLPEPCLLFSKKGVNCCGKPIEDYLAKNFACNRQQHYSPPVVAIS